MARRRSILILSLFWAGCAKDDIELIGCGDHLVAVQPSARTCELPDKGPERVVTVAIPEGAGKLKITVEGALFAADPEPPGHPELPYRVLRLQILAGMSSVRVNASGEKGRHRTTITIKRYESHPDIEEAIARLQSKQGAPAERFSASEKQLRRAMESTSGAVRSRALRYLVEVLTHEGYGTGDRRREAIALHLEGAALSRAAGEPSDAFWHRMKAARLRASFFNLNWLAESELNPAQKLPFEDELPAARAWAPFYRALVLERVDPSRALDAIADGLKWAAAYRWASVERQLCDEKARILFQLGSPAIPHCGSGARESLEKDPCWDAYLTLNHVAVAVDRLEEKYDDDEGLKLKGELRRILDLLEWGCSDPAKKELAKLQLSRVHFLAGEDMAPDALERPSSYEPEVLATYLDLRGSILLHSAPGAARAAFEALDRHARETALPAFRYRALIGVARSFEQDDPKVAVKKYEEAQAMLRELFGRGVFQMGAAPVLRELERGARAQVAFLLRQQGGERAAFEAVRRARVGVLAMPVLAAILQSAGQPDRDALTAARLRQEKARWERRPDAERDAEREVTDLVREILGRRAALLDPVEPSPPPPGEALFGCFPAVGVDKVTSPGRNWSCFVEDGERVVAKDFGELVVGRARPTLAAQIDCALWKAIGRAKVVRVLAWRDFGDVPMQLLEPPKACGVEPAAIPGDRTRPLFVDALDLPAAARATEDAGQPTSRRAVMAITAGDDAKPVAVAGEHVAGALRGARWVVDLSASPADVLAKLHSAAGLFVFAGHGRFAPDVAGLSSLVFDGSALLTSAHLLKDGARAAGAILIGCGTAGKADALGADVNFNVMEALLLNGSREVIAATRDITPAEGGLILERLQPRLANPAAVAYPLGAALGAALRPAAPGRLDDGPPEGAAFIRDFVY